MVAMGLPQVGSNVELNLADNLHIINQHDCIPEIAAGLAAFPARAYHLHPAPVVGSEQGNAPLFPDYGYSLLSK
jgi:hypothetical protein